jgi:hypothetical protein
METPEKVLVHEETEVNMVVLEPSQTAVHNSGSVEAEAGTMEGCNNCSQPLWRRLTGMMSQQTPKPKGTQPT